MLKKICHKPADGVKLYSNINCASLLCSLAGLIHAMGIVSVELMVLRHLFLLFDHTWLFSTWLSCDNPLVNDSILEIHLIQNAKRL